MNKNEDKPSFSPNEAAAISYLLPPITGIVIFIMEKENKFVRFHAFQSILFGFASIFVWIVTQALFIILIGIILAPLVSLAIFGTWLFLMWKAYNNIEYELPRLGKIAHDQANK